MNKVEVYFCSGEINGVARGNLEKIDNHMNVTITEATVEICINNKCSKMNYPKIVVRGSSIIAVAYMNNY